MGLDKANALQPEPIQDSTLFYQVVRSLPQGSTPVPRTIAAGITVCVDRSLWVDLLRNLVINAQRACSKLCLPWLTPAAESLQPTCPA